MADGSHPTWTRRLLVGAVVVVVVIVVALGARATVPRWWAQQVGDQIDGSLVMGTFVGLFYGFVFTVLPLLVIAAVLLWRRTLGALVFAVAVAIVLALPNLFTLGIVFGTGNAAHAAERTLDVEAPAFRGGSLVGALIAGAIVGLIVFLIISRGRGRVARDELSS